MVHNLRAQSREIQQLKKQTADITVEATKKELWAARLELGFVRQDEAHTGSEDVFDPNVVEDEEEIFASLPNDVHGGVTGRGDGG